MQVLAPDFGLGFPFSPPNKSRAGSQHGALQHIRNTQSTPSLQGRKLFDHECRQRPNQTVTLHALDFPDRLDLRPCDASCSHQFDRVHRVVLCRDDLKLDSLSGLPVFRQTYIGSRSTVEWSRCKANGNRFGQSCARLRTREFWQRLATTIIASNPVALA